VALLPLVAVVASGRTPIWRDTARLADPIRPLIVDALRSGSLPLWNPHEALGQPVFAHLMHGVLHPVSLALAFLAPSSGAEGMVIAYVAVAAAGCALLVRALGGSGLAAAAGGLAYAWSGYVLGMSSNLTFLAAGATAPWGIAALRRCAAGDGRSLAVGALGVAVLHFAGDPQWTIAAVSMGALLAFVTHGAPGLLRAGAATALGTAIAAVQLVPAWLALAETDRAAGLTAADRFQWAFSPWRVAELALPGLFGAPGEDTAVFLWLGGPAQAGLGEPFVPSVAVGATTLVLAAAGAAADRVGRALAGAAGILLWLALGWYAGAEQLLHSVPILGSFRYTEKWVGPLTLSLVVLGAIGLDAVRRGALQSRWAWVASAGVAALAGAAVLSGFRLDGAAPASAAWPLASAHLARGFAHAGVGLVALGLLLRAAPLERWGRWAIPALAALPCAAALASAPLAIHAAPAGLLDVSWLRELTSADGPVRIATPDDQSAYLVPRSLHQYDGADAARARHGAPPFTTRIGVDHIYSYTGLEQRRWRAFSWVFGSFDARSYWRAWRRLGVTHVIQKQPTSSPESLRAGTAVEGGRVVLENPEWWLTAWEVPHRPWAFFASSVRLAAGEDEARLLLREVLASGSEDVVLEAAGAPPLGWGRVLAIARGTDEVEVEAVAAQPGLLVIADAFAAGWSATVDGRPVPIWAADGMIRAVPFPAGRHRVQLRYRSPGLAEGVVVTMAALAATVVLVARQRRGALPRAAPVRARPENRTG
jgi:hypothetical protein